MPTIPSATALKFMYLVQFMIGLLPVLTATESMCMCIYGVGAGGALQMSWRCTTIRQSTLFSEKQPNPKKTQAQKKQSTPACKSLGHRKTLVMVR